MRGNFRGKASQSGGDEIGRGHHAEQGSSDFPARMAGTRHEMLDDQRDDEKETQNDAADPPGNGRPANLDWGFLLELEKEQARGGENGAREEESGTEDQGDAVLRALKANEGHGGEDKGEQAGRDLQIALQDGVRLEGNDAQPHRQEENDDKAGNTRQDGSVAIAGGNESGLGHCFSSVGRGAYLIRL